MKTEGSQNYLLVQVLDITYAIDILKVYHIYEVDNICSVPNSPAYFAGLMRTSDGYLPILDLRILFGKETMDINKQTVIVAATCNFKDETVTQIQDFGFLVDAVSDVIEIEHSSIEKPTVPESKIVNPCFTGIVRLKEQIVLILDIDILINSRYQLINSIQSQEVA
jgi:purine-binding chemotaxis protein CheW